MCKHFKYLVLLSFLTIPSLSSAQVWIDGREYPNGCYKYDKVIDGKQYWGVMCPSYEYSDAAEYWRNKQVDQLPGHPSEKLTFENKITTNPINCRHAIKNLSDTLGAALAWLDLSRYGQPQNRKLTGFAAVAVYDILREYGTRIIREGENKYRFSSRKENGDLACAEHVKAGKIEIERLINLVKNEAEKGNSDLVGTGLNPRPSEYNK